jgi:hypothetical protein
MEISMERRGERKKEIRNGGYTKMLVKGSRNGITRHNREEESMDFTQAHKISCAV